MKKLVALLFILLLSSAVPSLTHAQSVSKDFPNIPEVVGCGGAARNVPSTAGTPAVAEKMRVWSGTEGLQWQGNKWRKVA